MKKNSWFRHIVALLVALGGCLGVMALLVVMNARDVTKSKKKSTKKLAFRFVPPRPPPVRRKVQRKPRKARPKRAPRAPLPRLASSLSNVDFGIPSAVSTGLDDVSDKLLGKDGANGLVMTEKSVDRPPKAVHQVAPQYPPRARAKNIAGQVVMNLLIGAQGDVQDAKIVNATPSGIFDQSALQAVRQWRFQPAMYKGAPVVVRAQQVMKFQLN